MPEKRGQYQYNDDGTVAALVQSNTVIDESKAIVPVEIQARYAQTIQTHTNVVVTPNNFNVGTFVDTDGFDRISATVSSGSSFAVQTALDWSNDGSTTIIQEVSTTSTKNVNLDTTTKARYVKVYAFNKDATNPQTLNSSVYLKA